MTSFNSIYSRFVSLKGEFEAEGLTRDEVTSEALFAAQRHLDYLVKVGGCEARSDIVFLKQIGITSLTAPMIETAFAMEKYMGALPDGMFHHVGVTIETFTAANNIESILDAGTKLTDVTIGRSDLTASFRGPGVDSPETIDKVKIIARAAKARGFKVTMGGSVSADTRELLRTDQELYELLDHVETRKAIMTVDQMLLDGTLEAAIEAELDLLKRRSGVLNRRGDEVNARVGKISERL